MSGGDPKCAGAGNVGARVEVVAHGEVSVVAVSHDAVHMLAALQPSIGARFYRSLALCAAKRLRQHFADMLHRTALLDGSADSEHCA